MVNLINFLSAGLSEPTNFNILTNRNNKHNIMV